MFDTKRPVITKENEAKVERMIEQDFASHRDCPNGRNFLAWNMTDREFQGYREKFDKTFKTSPGSDDWFESRYCPVCDRLKVQCLCAIGIEIPKDEKPFVGWHSGRMK